MGWAVLLWTPIVVTMEVEVVVETDAAVTLIVPLFATLYTGIV